MRTNGKEFFGRAMVLRRRIVQGVARGELKWAERQLCPTKSALHLRVNLRALLTKFLRLGFHALLQRLFRGEAKPLRGVSGFKLI